ncbi:MAG: hydroxysqualene dehydroxylase HpnE [Frankiaceae bacterium]
MSGIAAPARVVVVGGGLAGLSAAIGAVDAGAAVTLLESRPRLGGATHSFSRSGLVVDNGQHVLLRCCTAYLGFLRRLGVADWTAMQPRLAVPVVRPGAPRPVWLRRGGLPAPLHLAPAVLAYRQLSPLERLKVPRAALALRRLDPDDEGLDAASFGDWLRRHGQSRNAIDALWDLICTATLNTPPDAASLKLAAKVFRTGLLEDKAAADIGYPLVPLGRLHGEAAERALAAAGATVRLRTRVRAVERDGGGFGVVTDEGRVPADAVVVAVPHDAAGGLLPPGTVRAQERLGELGASPILDVHVVYDRRVTDLPLLGAIGTPAQWIFDRTESSGLAAGGGGEQYLAVSVSAADALIDRSVAELRELFLPELGRLLPRARDARVVELFVTRERTATFRQGPGSHSLRAGTRTALPGLYLAGAWTDTGWPATMEGAVRSGRAAAEAVVAGLGGRTGGRLPEGAAA